MKNTAPTSSEWFDAIPAWSSSRRRIGYGVAIAFVAGIGAAIVSWLCLPLPPGSAAFPMPAWNAARFVDGELARQFERHCKESAWVTHRLRGIHGAVASALGLQSQLLLGQCHFELTDGTVLDGMALMEAATRGFVVNPPWPTPRARPTVGPNQSFFLCYSDHEVLRRPWLDERGRVEMRMNQFAQRDRADVSEQKPPGELRVLTLGDSITMAWGVPEESGWPRQLERSLRRDRPEVRVVNAGGTGAAYVDEYLAALTGRWHTFDPDAVVIGICLNDLLPSNNLCIFVPTAEAAQRAGLPNLRRSRDPLDLDPDVDWVTWLLGLDKEAGDAVGLGGPFDGMWASGVPQSSLLAMRDWCRARQIPLVVTLWPLLQGLGPGRKYPFTSMHEKLAAFCRDHAIPFVDLLPVLRDVPQEDLWVTPADMHPNPRAHALAVPPIQEVLARLLRR